MGFSPSFPAASFRKVKVETDSENCASGQAKIVVTGAGYSTEPEPHKMKAKRRGHEPGFKARVALEALKGIQTIKKIAKQ